MAALLVSRDKLKKLLEQKELRLRSKAEVCALLRRPSR